MTFDGVPIGISYGSPECRRFCLGRCRVSGCPGLENALGAVEMLLVPNDRNHFESPVGLAELVPKLPVGLAPGIQLASGGHARIDVGQGNLINLDVDRHLDVEIPDASAGAAGVKWKPWA